GRGATADAAGGALAAVQHPARLGPPARLGRVPGGRRGGGPAALGPPAAGAPWLRRAPWISRWRPCPTWCGGGRPMTSGGWSSAAWRWRCSAVLAGGRAFGFVPRVPDALTFAREARVLLLRHAPTGIDVDVALGSLPFEEEALRRARAVRVARVSVPLPTPEDLIIMKAVAHRERDLLDIDGLLAA